MEEPRERLKQARLAKGYETRSEASRATKLNLHSWNSHENGNREISLKAALKYGSALDVDPAWIIYGANHESATMKEAIDKVLLDLGTTTPSADDDYDPDLGEATPGYPVIQIPVVSWVSAGGLKKRDGVILDEVERYLPIADLPRGDWLALKVEGDSMNRIAPDGSIIIVNRADDSLINDRYYVFALDGGETTFKRFRRTPRPMLQPFSTNLDHMSLPVDEDDVYVVGRVRRVITDL
ncbi:hypothetical protein ASG54_21825 [Aureimonas sp. Leaf460]|nr:hypothetical protein ASG62_16125 [Aureimonas sp. Leaf427]KQT70583.1 hypothetical protein ASG54_21825 [Aureimonas sp. Leaf460]